MEQETKTEELTDRIIFPLAPSLTKRIADYRFSRRINTKSEAVRRLIEAGLAAEDKKSK